MCENLDCGGATAVGRNVINGYRADQPPPQTWTKRHLQHFPPTVIKIEKPSTIFPSHCFKGLKGYSLSEVGMWRAGRQPYPFEVP